MEKSKEEQIVELLNKAWDLLPEKPTYEELNKLLPMKENVGKLRELEEKNPSLGIAKYNTENEGISFLSIIATITDIYCGKRLGINVDIPEFVRKGLTYDQMTDEELEAIEKSKVTGFCWV